MSLQLVDKTTRASVHCTVYSQGLNNNPQRQHKLRLATERIFFHLNYKVNKNISGCQVPIINFKNGKEKRAGSLKISILDII